MSKLHTNDADYLLLKEDTGVSLQSGGVVQRCFTLSKAFDVVKVMYKECKKHFIFHHNGPNTTLLKISGGTYEDR